MMRRLLARSWSILTNPERALGLMRLFVMTLGYSRKAVRLLTFRSRSRIWAELHEKAFRRLGGRGRIVLLDNLAEGVLVPDIYDPSLNPLRPRRVIDWARVPDDEATGVRNLGLFAAQENCSILHIQEPAFPFRVQKCRCWES